MPCVFATDNVSATMMQLTDEDKTQLKRWQQMQHQQRAVSMLLSAFNTATTASRDVTTTVATTTATTTTTTSTTTCDTGALELDSADSKLADECLADTEVMWNPSVSLSSADLASCLQTTDSAAATTTVATTTATTTTSTTTDDAGALQLNSSELANECLADAEVMWNLSVDLLSAELASCLHTTDSVAAAAAAVGDDDHHVTTTVATTTTTTTTDDAGALQLDSADSKLADECLADAEIVWSPSINLSSADIASSLQTTGSDAGAGGGDGSHATTVTRLYSCAAYGVGEVIPSSSDRYVLSFRCMHWHW